MRTALILGASRGLGLELVRQYRGDGWRVIATARDTAGLARLAALDAEPLTLDVANPESVPGFEWHIEGEKLDVAFYVAGLIDHGNAKSPPTQAVFDEVMRTNVWGAMQLIPSVAPGVERARGRFAFVSSLMGSIAATDSSDDLLYRASKAALNMVVRGAQQDYPAAIMVAISPGWVRTDMGGVSAPLSVQESVRGMREVVARADAGSRGAFLRYDGSTIQW
ncbi:MAG: SDR family oxidoreductase [Burkholderiales bacterium]